MEKRPYGRISAKKLAVGLVAGMTKCKAGEYAGSKARSIEGIIKSVNEKMQTEEFKNESKKFTDKLEAEIERIMNAIGEKNLGGVEHESLVKSIEKLSKLQELLKGNSTDRIELDTVGLKDFLANS